MDGKKENRVKHIAIQQKVKSEDMNVYLDTSALNRIFDDQSQPRIFLEASAMLLVFGLIEKRIISIVSSEVLIYENL